MAETRDTERTVYLARRPINTDNPSLSLYERGLCVLLEIASRGPDGHITYHLPFTVHALKCIRDVEELGRAGKLHLSLGEGQRLVIEAVLLKYPPATGVNVFWIDVDTLAAPNDTLWLPPGLSDAVRLAYQSGIATKGIQLVTKTQMAPSADSILD